MQAEQIDPIVLETLNNLRLLENRKPLTQLQPYYRNLSQIQLIQLVKSWKEQIEVHKELKANSKEYNNRIILNVTEQALYNRNKRNPDNQATYLKYNQIAEPDRVLYFPTGEVNPEDRHFITDTDATYIQSLTIVTAKDRNYCLAKHSLPDCISYTPGTAELIPIIKRVSRTKPDSSLILETRLRPRAGSIIESTESLRKELDAALHTQAKDPKTEKATLATVQSKDSVQKPTIFIRKGSCNPNKIYTYVSKDSFSNPNATLQNSAINRGIDNSNMEEEVNAFLEARVTELITKHMGDMYAKGGYRPPQAPPPEEPRGDPDDIETLRKELELLKASQSTNKQFVPTDKQLIIDLRKDMSNMITYINQLQGEMEKNKLLPEEKLKLQQMSGPTSTTANPLVYKLEYPTNLIDHKTIRGPLTILKPHSIIATVGSFDPDINPKANFKETWERIQNYTRNYDLYEHEYVDILMVLMKGTAASSLTDMIREYKGKLSKILDAIQDLYVPHHTIFDDMDDLNKFVRPPQENIRTTMRRAGLLINRMKNQCSPAAWPERRYHMLTALIKQVIHVETARHLYAEELKCAQTGTQLDIPAIISVIALHEQTHDLIPKQEMKIKVNLNSMQVIEHNTQPIKALDIKNKKTERERERSSDRMNRSRSKERPQSQNKPYNNNNNRDRDRDRSQERRKSRDDYKPSYKPNQNKTPYKEGMERNRYRSESADSQKYYNPSQRRNDGQRDYKDKATQQRQSRSQSIGNNSQERERSKSNDGYYRSKSPYSSNNYRAQQKQTYDRNPNKNNYKSQTSNPNSKYEKTFRNGKHVVTLHFYKCQACPSMHPTGSNCDQPKPPLNM